MVGALLAVVALIGACAGPASELPSARREAPRPSPPARYAPFGGEPGPPSAPSGAGVVGEGCGDTEVGFEPWLEGYRRYALGQGISARTLDLALSGITYDGEVTRLDRSQKAFKLSFEEFTAKRVTPARMKRGKALLGRHAALLARIEARFGVAPEILVAIWGLETDYGANSGSMSCLRSLATLAYDCRRAARFRGELLSALRIVERGDLPVGAMVGAWAGELGQTQFLPSSYEAFAVDFDGDRRADLIGSSADALASTASYLAGHGWRAREGYGAGTPNFVALGEWNASEVYRRAIVHFALELRRR